MTADGRAKRGCWRRAEAPLYVASVLLFTGILGYVWLANRLLEIDEYLSYYTDSQATFGKVLWVQLHYPISLDPPTYHLLSHAMMQIAGNGPVGLRLPALFGFLLFQLSLFCFLRRIAGVRASVLAMLIPLLTVTWFYGVQGRPYGLLLGLNGMALACWQTAIRTSSASRRFFALVGLSLALVLAITSHFFGLLVLVPVSAGELFRILKSRRVDWPVAASIGIGVVSVAAVVPFQHAVSMYRAHYYSTSVSWRIIPQAYAALIYWHHTLSSYGQHIFLVALGLACTLLAAGLLWRFRTADRQLAPTSELIALATVTLFPVYAFLVGHFVAHTADVRYMIPALFGVMALAGIVLQPLVNRTSIFWILFVGLLCGALYQQHRYLSDVESARRDLPSHFYLSPEVRAALNRDPSRRIYVQSLGDFYFNTYYEPDPALRGRFSLVYAEEPEMDWLRHDTNYITAINMQQFTALSMRSYSELLAQRDPLVLNYVDGWDWMAHDLEAHSIPMNSIGPLMRGQLVELRINETQPVLNPLQGKYVDTAQVRSPGTAGSRNQVR